jgi:hypothetical protein
MTKTGFYLNKYRIIRIIHYIYMISHKVGVLPIAVLKEESSIVDTILACI